MRTVREALIAFAAEARVDPEEYLRVRLGGCVGPTVPERYRRLVMEVVCRLPEDWDAHATWSVEASEEQNVRGYASALREEEAEGDIEESDQIWTVTLYPALLNRLSDAACQWVIAHELSHVASGLPTGSIVIGGKPHTRVKGTVDRYVEAPERNVCEDAADGRVLDWGFSMELDAFLRED